MELISASGLFEVDLRRSDTPSAPFEFELVRDLATADSDPVGLLVPLVHVNSWLGAGTSQPRISPVAVRGCVRASAEFRDDGPVGADGDRPAERVGECRGRIDAEFVIHRDQQVLRRDRSVFRLFPF